MYSGAKNWGVFAGCGHGCAYCKASFQAQLKRWAKGNCGQCYEFVPHEHPERLNKIPNPLPNLKGERIVFVSGSGDLSFSTEKFVRQIIASIKVHNKRGSHSKTYYFQSKNPRYFAPFLDDLPGNVILVTTLETNRDQAYSQLSKAPLPSARFRDFKDLDYRRKVVTIEPVMDFDPGIFGRWIAEIDPEYVWIGYNSKPGVQLLEPPLEKVLGFINYLEGVGFEVRRKRLEKTVH